MKKTFCSTTLVAKVMLRYARCTRPLVVAVALLFCVLLTACEQSISRLSGQTMGTGYTVTFAEALPAADGAALKNLIERSLDQVNASMSTYIDHSEISVFNRSRSTQWQPASELLIEVLIKAQHVSRLTDGAFDVTVEPLVDLWGFGPVPAPDRLPTEYEIAQCMQHVGYQHLAIHPGKKMIRKDIPDLTIDVSAIAKGYAVDRIARLLDVEGIGHYLIDIGGELRARGLNAAGAVWRVGIEHPNTSRPAVATVQLDHAAIATSGDYRNYREFDGKRYSHLIDPRVGRPVTHRVAAVTVIAERVIEADAWATALLVLGAERGMVLAQDEGIAARFTLRGADGYTTKISEAFAVYL